MSVFIFGSWGNSFSNDSDKEMNPNDQVHTEYLHRSVQICGFDYHEGWATDDVTMTFYMFVVVEYVIELDVYGLNRS